MFCRNCGKEVSDKAVACPACGVPPLTEKKFCHNCGCVTQSIQAICVKCGVNLAGGDVAHALLARFSSSRILGGVRLGIAIIIYLWASAHSPHMGFVEMMSKPDTFVLKEPAYSGVFLVAALLAIQGAINIYKSFQSGAKTDKK